MGNDASEMAKIKSDAGIKIDVRTAFLEGSLPGGNLADILEEVSAEFGKTALWYMNKESIKDPRNIRQIIDGLKKGSSASWSAAKRLEKIVDNADKQIP